MLYATNWLYGDGHGLLYQANLYASVYDPTLTNPPASQIGCSNCTYTYSYAPPPYLTTGDAITAAAWVDATTLAGNPTSTAVSMPAYRTVGWSQEPNGTPAVTWTAIAPDNAAPGTTPATDGLVLRMLSKYNPTTNPAGLRRPAYGDYTPLTGTMQNVKTYMQTVINADPYAACRHYYVMLLTDGGEQPVNASLNAAAAVQALRSPANGGTMVTSSGVPVDIKTFVIGFGIDPTSPDQIALNAMARPAGRRCCPTASPSPRTAAPSERRTTTRFWPLSPPPSGTSSPASSPGRPRW